MHIKDCTMTILSVHVLICLFAVSFYYDYTQAACCKDCCDSICNAPPPVNITLQEFALNQRLYVTFLPAIPLFAGYDNVCYTYTPLYKGAYLNNVATVYTCGFQTVASYIVEMSTPGVFQTGSATSNENLIIFEYLQTSECNIFIGYDCFLYGGLIYKKGNKIPVYGLSSSFKAISKECLASAVEAISNAGVNSQDYFILPMKMKSACQ